MVLPDEFLRMIEASDSLALILVAHWVLLLSMQEESYWFMEGQSQGLLNIVLANLEAELEEFVRSCLIKFGQLKHRCINRQILAMIEHAKYMYHLDSDELFPLFDLLTFKQGRCCGRACPTFLLSDSPQEHRPCNSSSFSYQQ